MQRFTDLATIRRRVWDRLRAAATEPGHPLRALSFGTSTDGRPQLRTVILRDADPDERVLAFHTDRQSQKVADIRAEEKITWLGWTPETREQVRLSGTASLHFDDAVAEEMWQEQSPGSLDLYVRERAPGTPLEAPRDGRDAAVKTDPVTREDVADGRPNFAVVRTVIDGIDWLHLHPEGHYRAQFQFDAEADAFEGGWVVP